MKILFMGTPDFAVPSLKALCDTGEQIVGVVTQPDKPKGRNYVLTPPPVKVFAMENNLPVYQPKTLRDEAFAELLDTLAPDMIVVIAFGKILPQNVLDYPKYGCINVHGSLLPAYRGAAPMQRAIINGEKVTGITTMYMDGGIDTGDMLLKAEFPIGENDNFETVHDGLSALGAKTLIQTIEMLKSDTVIRQKQDDSLATYAAKIEKTDCLLDFSKEATALHNLIRGLSPIPLAFTHTPDGKILKVTASRVISADQPHKICGKVLALEEEIHVACAIGTLALVGVLPEGKGKMNAADFIRGRKIAVGDILA